MAQNPIGISKRDMGRPERAEIRLTTGIKRAAAPTFCIKEEMIATVLDTIGIIRFSEVPPVCKINEATLLIIPVLSKPAPIIITAIMDITALLEKPLNNLSLETRPASSPIIGANNVDRPSSTIIDIAVTSTSTTSKANK